jgi:uncharacterized membrane protein YphA (DoxX/SURF4 family)
VRANYACRAEQNHRQDRHTVKTRQDSTAAGLAALRITLGVIILRTWFDNLDKDLYTGDGLEAFLDFLFSPDGNDSSLGFYESLLDAIVVPISGLYAAVQLVVELAIGIGLIIGGFTRLCSLIAAVFFFNLLLAYFGGNEWIWTYVLLFVSSVVVYLSAAGRTWGVDARLAARHQNSKLSRLW